MRWKIILRWWGGLTIFAELLFKVGEGTVASISSKLDALLSCIRCWAWKFFRGVLMKWITLPAATFLLAATFNSVASRADSVSITNYSFEANTVVDNNNTPISGWTFAVNDYSGVQDQGPYHAGPPPSGNPIGTDGTNWAFVNLTNSNNPLNPASGTITSDLVTTFAPNTTYDLTVAVGSNTQLNYGYYAPGNFVVSILANGTPVASGSLDGSTLTLGTLVDLSTTPFTTGASGGVVGDNLTIQLYSVSNNTSQNGGGQQSLFDNVRLSASPVPEPASLLLSGFAAIGLGLIAWRRCKL